MTHRINEIQQSILDKKATISELSALEVLTTQEQSLQEINSNSKVAVWRLWVWVMSFAIFSLERLMAIFQEDVEKRIAATRIHTQKWYRDKALAFLYGVPLVADTDIFDLTGLDEQAIKSAKIVANAASIRIVENGYGTLRIKAVGSLNGEYVPLLPVQIWALSVYFNQYVADAGTLVLVTSGEADLLKLKLDIYFDPLQLSPTGTRLNNTNDNPVLEAIHEFLQSINFENGTFITSYLTAHIQSVPGVSIAVVLEARSKFGSYDYEDASTLGVGLINEIRAADSGYMRLDLNALQINYIPYH